ncbi:MAG: hypothetical protein M0Z95_27280 [Actinomycetota bacterium]|nr:hypothetical protein [Actinomycetota bacterium]
MAAGRIPDPPRAQNRRSAPWVTRCAAVSLEPLRRLAGVEVDVAAFVLHDPLERTRW